MLIQFAGKIVAIGGQYLRAKLFLILKIVIKRPFRHLNFFTTASTPDAVKPNSVIISNPLCIRTFLVSEYSRSILGGRPRRRFTGCCSLTFFLMSLLFHTILQILRSGYHKVSGHEQNQTLCFPLLDNIRINRAQPECALQCNQS